jgi:molybdate transport system ATP-binding protein
MIELENVTVSKAGRRLFENLNFTFKPGENWVIQGDNGSGKTALLQLIAGVLHPLAGKVTHSFIEGSDWDTLYQQRQEKIHFVPTHWLQSFLQGFGSLFYQQRYYTMDDTVLPRVRDVFGNDLHKLETFGFSESFDLHALLNLHLTRLSNGQLKKVVIVRQLVKSIPRLLLLDYPFDGLDAESRRDFGRFIDKLSLQFDMQIMLVDHGHTLPSVINRRMTLNNLKIQKIENIIRDTPATHNHEHINPPPAAERNDPIVEMRDVTIQYSGKTIIKDLNWRINKGERWALTGKNGSGKTTLFSLIYADHPMAYSQQVYLFGRRRGSGESIWDIKRRINYFGPEQLHFLMPGTLTLSGREFVLSQKHKDPKRLSNLIDFFHAQDFIDEQVRFLSSGQIQLLLLMNMFLDDKELLLLDEPFQFLDPDHHQRVTRYLNHYLDQNITLILITHDEKDVERWTQLRKHL